MPDIWWSLKGSLFAHVVCNKDFRLRHRKIYSNVVLRQIYRERYDCGTVPETLEHIFMECPVVLPFLQEVRHFEDKVCL